MFGKVRGREDLVSTQLVKTSVQRALRKSLVERLVANAGVSEDAAEEMLERVIPKKAQLVQVRLADSFASFYCLSETGETVLFEDDPYARLDDAEKERVSPAAYPPAVLPTLRTLHRLPGLLPHATVDSGAVKFVLSGADVMCPGLTSAKSGRTLARDLAPGAYVAVTVAGHRHAIAVGAMAMGGADVFRVNRGPAVVSLHYLLDGLWRLGSLAIGANGKLL